MFTISRVQIRGGAVHRVRLLYGLFLFLWVAVIVFLGSGIAFEAYKLVCPPFHSDQEPGIQRGLALAIEAIAGWEYGCF